jgi:hypothetical protein
MENVNTEMRFRNKYGIVECLRDFFNPKQIKHLNNNTINTIKTPQTSTKCFIPNKPDN